MLTSDGEFHSFRRQAARWEEEGLIRRRIVPCEPFDTFTERFLAAMRRKGAGHRFRQPRDVSKSGLRFDGIEELGVATRAPQGTWVVIDGYHSFMAMPMDLGASRDRVFLLGGGYKYAMAGEGAAYVHAPPGYGAAPRRTPAGSRISRAMEAKQGSSVGYSADGMRFMGATFDRDGAVSLQRGARDAAREELDTAKISARVAAFARAAGGRRSTAGDAGVLAEAELLRPNAKGPQRALHCAASPQGDGSGKPQLMAQEHHHRRA